MTRPHYAALDALRGVAALIVLAHHLENEAHQAFLFRHAYLAVDFFFVLSGFVVALAYEARLRDGMSFGAFTRARFIRLYPMIFAGALIGAAVALALGSEVNFGPALISQLLLIPGLAGGGALFLLNGPHWSLVLEIAANLTHAAGLRWASLRVLCLGVALSALGLVVVAWQFHHLSTGWSFHNWWAGVPRIAFSYGLGVLLYRLHALGRLPQLTLSFPVVAALLIASLVGVSLWDHWMGDLVFVLLLSPTILVAGIGCPETREARIPALLGAVSYPLYAIHAPMVTIWGATAPASLLSGLAALVAMTAIAVLVERHYERPARRLLAGWFGAVVKREPLPTTSGPG